MPSAYKGVVYETHFDQHGAYVLKNELYNTNSAFNEVTRPNLVYDIYFDPQTGDVKTTPVSQEHVYQGYVKIRPKANNNGVNKYHAFRWSPAKVIAEPHNLEFVQTPSGYRVFTKVRDVDSTALKDIAIGISTVDGSTDLATLGIDPAWFDYPKPSRLLQVLVAATTERDSLVLDFFAGSGSTAHAVALQNEVDNGVRRVISVNLQEPTADDSEARKAGLEVVSDITRARLSAIASKVTGAGDLGLRIFRLTESNFESAEDAGSTDQFAFRESTLHDGAQFEAIAAEVLLKEGVALDAAWDRREIRGVPVITAAGVAIVLSLDTTNDVVTDVLELDPRVIVFLEDGFAGRDAVKANAVTTAKSRGITMKTV
jgi:adenine-specific DNA-methyltransferase